MLLLHALPVCMFHYFPSQDGPSHLANANILRLIADPDHQQYRQFYYINPRPEPNWLGHLVLAALLTLFSVSVSEKLLLLCYVLLLPLSVRYALSAIDPKMKALSLFSFVFVYNLLFHLGFYNFSLSIIMFFFCVGFWIQYRGDFNLRQGIVFSCLLLVVYFCHIFSLVTALLAIAIIGSSWILAAVCYSQHRDRFLSISFLAIFWKELRRHFEKTFYCSIPALALAFTFFLNKGLRRAEVLPAKDLGKKLLRLESLVSFDQEVVYLSSLVAAVFAIVLCTILAHKIWNRDINRFDGILLVLLAFLCIYFMAPDSMAGGDYISDRMMLYPFFAAILWFGAQGHFHKLGVLSAHVVLLLSVAMLVRHTAKYAEINEYLEEYTSAAKFIPEKSLLLPVSLARKGPVVDGQPVAGKVSSFLHASGHIVAQNNIIDVSDYEPWKGYFPLLYRPETDPFIHLARDQYGLVATYPRVDIAHYHQQTGLQIEFILLFGFSETMLQQPDMADFYDQLQADYQRIFTSTPKGLVELYQLQK